jgi:hypothetical protein
MQQTDFQQKYHQELRIAEARKDLFKKIEQERLVIDIWWDDWDSEDGWSIEQGFYWYEIQALKTFGFEYEFIEWMYEHGHFEDTMNPGSSGKWARMILFTPTVALLSEYMHSEKTSDVGQLEIFEKESA